MKNPKRRRLAIHTLRGRLLLDGLTIKGWAKLRGFHPDTVYKVLYGTRGKAGRGICLEIEEALKREGYWPPDGESSEAVNG
jgi:gp16 family phage-associated protein